MRLLSALLLAAIVALASAADTWVEVCHGSSCPMGRALACPTASACYGVRDGGKLIASNAKGEFTEVATSLTKINTIAGSPDGLVIFVGGADANGAAAVTSIDGGKSFQPLAVPYPAEGPNKDEVADVKYLPGSLDSFIFTLPGARALGTASAHAPGEGALFLLESMCAKGNTIDRLALHGNGNNANRDFQHFVAACNSPAGASTLLRSEDGGESWAVTLTVDDAVFVDVACPTQDNCVAAVLEDNANASLFYSTDGGANFARAFRQGSALITAMAAPAAAKGDNAAVAVGALQAKSEDGQFTGTLLRSKTAGKMFAISKKDKSVHGFDAVAVTADGTAAFATVALSARAGDTALLKLDIPQL